jgi:hypothetical protein
MEMTGKRVQEQNARKEKEGRIIGGGNRRGG